jgi:hypothetical protein
MPVIGSMVGTPKSPAEAGLKFAMNGGASDLRMPDQRIARGGRDYRAGVRGFLLHRVLLRNGLGHGGWRWRGHDARRLGRRLFEAVLSLAFGDDGRRFGDHRRCLGNGGFG